MEKNKKIEKSIDVRTIVLYNNKCSKEAAKSEPFRTERKRSKDCRNQKQDIPKLLLRHSNYCFTTKIFVGELIPFHLIINRGDKNDNSNQNNN